MWIYYLVSSLILLYGAGYYFSRKEIIALQKTGYSYYERTDAFNPLIWYQFIAGYLLHWVMPRYVMEQYLIRFYDDFCRKNCYLSEDGKCVNCGCDVNKKVLVPGATCAGGYWGPIVWNKKEYIKFREEYPVEIKITYKTKGENGTI